MKTTTTASSKFTARAVKSTDARKPAIMSALKAISKGTKVTSVTQVGPTEFTGECYQRDLKTRKGYAALGNFTVVMAIGEQAASIVASPAVAALLTKAPAKVAMTIVNDAPTAAELATLSAEETAMLAAFEAEFAAATHPCTNANCKNNICMAAQAKVVIPAKAVKVVAGSISLLTKENPKRGASAVRFAIYKNGMTVEAFLAAGGTRADLRWDTAHGFIAVK